MSLIGALTPLGKVAGRKGRWFVNVTTYTLTGVVSSAFTGAVLGSIGGLLIAFFSLILPGQLMEFKLVVALAVALLAVAREFNWISFSLPQLKRQTRSTWAQAFPSTLAAALWGLDLGFIFSTRLTFSGVWVLAFVSLLIGDPLFGAILFTLYWLGRALSVWIMPFLLPDSSATLELPDAVDRQQRLFQQIHAWGLVWSIVVLVMMLTMGSQM